MTYKIPYALVHTLTPVKAKPAMQINENELSRQLDGSFFKYEPVHDIFVQRQVSTDFIPEYRANVEGRYLMFVTGFEKKANYISTGNSAENNVVPTKVRKKELTFNQRMKLKLKRSKL